MSEKEPKKSFGVTFMRTHPGEEKKHGLDSTHAIIDRRDIHVAHHIANESFHKDKEIQLLSDANKELSEKVGELEAKNKEAEKIIKSTADRAIVD